jgi:methyl-accepting chemotaxis protein
MTIPFLNNFLNKVSYKLSSKISFFVTVLMVISLIIFASVFVISEYTKVRSDIEKQGEVFAEFTARSIYQDYLQFYTRPDDGEFKKFKIRVEDKLKHNKDVKHILLVGTNGTILFDSIELTDGKYKDQTVRKISNSTTLELIKKHKVSHQPTKLPSGDEATDIIIPLIEVNNDHDLSVIYTVSYESLKERMSEIYQQIIFTSIPLLFFAIFFTLPFSKTITRSIDSLIQAVEEIGEGKFDTKVRVESQDEIGKLSQTFNQMTDDLKKSREEIQNYTQELELKVQERTKELGKKVKELESFNMIEMKKELDQLKQKVG